MTTAKITYAAYALGSKSRTAVFLDGKRVGTISQQFDGMWQYFPTGKIDGGEKFPTLAGVKVSLEAA